MRKILVDFEESQAEELINHFGRGTPSNENISIIMQMVTLILNEKSTSQLSSIVAPSYRDNDPVVIPGYLMPRRRSWGTFSDFEKFAAFLDLPLVDVRFTVEEVFSQGHCVALRLFGEGTMPKWKMTHLPKIQESPLPADVAERVKDEGLSGDDPKMQHLMIDSVQVWHLRNGRIQEKWGPWRARTVDI